MGTSSSYGGPGDKTPLLPAWALPGGGDAAQPEEEAPEGDGDKDNAIQDGADQSGDESPESDAEDTASTEDEASSDSSSESSQAEPAAGPQAPLRSHWQSAKTQLGKAVASRGGSSGYGTAARAYVRALGGHRNAAASSRSSRTSTRALGGFLSDVRNHGLDGALERIGLRDAVGKDVHTVFAAIVDAITPEGSTREEVAAREAVCETLADLFGQYITDDPTGNTLAEAMTPDGVRGAVESCVVAAAFNRWLDDLARQIESKAISTAEALKAERDIHKYMVDTVKLDFEQKDPLTMEWKTDGQQLIDRLYDDAYRMLGENQ